jgi:hypothetical protein
MIPQFSNLPATPPPNINSTDGTLQSFNTYYSAPIELDAGTYSAMTGFFESKGFDPAAASSISVIIMSQAKIDNYNPMTVLDGLQGLDGVEISNLATQILNYNRFKSSFLGYTTPLRPFSQVQRNILA